MKSSFTIFCALRLFSRASAFATIRTNRRFGGVRTDTLGRQQWSAASFPPSTALKRTDPSSAPITRLEMYNLPGGGNKKDDVVDILKGIGGLALVIGFFASPLGGLVLGVFNSFLVLSLLLPILGTVGFQIWQSFNTVSGTCPNCQAPARVLKQKPDEPPTPTLCFNCGAVLQANYENTGIDNVTGRNSMGDDLGGSAFGSIFDIFGGAGPGSFTTENVYYEEQERQTQNQKSSKSKPKKRKEEDIIDVEIEDKPWQ